MFTMDESGEGHFKGHAKLSAEMAEVIMQRLRYDNQTIERTCRLIALHSDKLKTDIQVRKLLGQLGEEDFCKLMEFKKADNSAKNGFVLSDNEMFDSFIEKAHRLIREGFCLTLGQLAVNGQDMLALGLKGKAVGEALSELLGKVIEEELPNEKDALTDYIRGKGK